MTSMSIQGIFRKIDASVSTVFAVGLSALALATATAGPRPWAHETGDLPPESGVIWGTLDNGLRYAIMPNVEPPERVSLRLLVETGSLMEEEDQRGLAHFLEHMAFNGTKSFPAGEMIEYFQRLGMAFGADTNAHTSFHETVYKLELPKNDLAILDESIKLFRDYADGMILDIKEINKERGVILSEKRTRDSAGWRTFVAQIEFTLPDALLTQRLPIGTEEVIQNAPAERFEAYYRKWYTLDRLAVVAVGSIDEKTLVPLLEKYFGNLKAPETILADPKPGPVVPRGLVAHLHSEPEAPAAEISILNLTPYEKQPDTRAEREKNLTFNIACAMISRRLEILSKEEGSPFARGSAFSQNWFNFVTLAGIDMTCQPAQWADALQTAEKELRRALTHGFTQGELDEIKASVLNGFEERVKSAPTRKSRGLADGLVSSIREDDVFTSPKTELEWAKTTLEGITPGKCLDALKEVWKGEDTQIFVSGNLTLDNASEKILAVYKSSKQTPVDPPAEHEQVAFAYTDFGGPGQIASKVSHDDLGIIQIRFANNVRLNIKKTDFEKNRVHILARTGGGLLTAPKDKPGLPVVADFTMVPGGLGAHSQTDLQRILAGRTVSTGFSVEDDAFVFNGHTNPEDMLLQMQLICAYLTDSGFRDESLRQLRKNLDQIYTQLAHTPGGIMQNAVDPFLRGGDPRFGFPAKAEMEARNLDEVRAWLTPILKSGYLEISVVGDIDPDVVTAAARMTFGALSDRKEEKPPFTRERELTFPRDVSYRVFPFQSAIPKALASVFWPSTDMSDIGRARRLNVLASVLSDRMRIKIREEIGESYSPRARNSSSDTFTQYGAIGALILAAPEQAEGLTALVQEIGQKLASEGTQADELERVVKPLLTSLDEQQRNNAYWLNTVLGSSQENPARLDWARTIRSDYSSIQVKEINALARQYLREEHALRLTIMPFEEASQMPPATSAAAK